MRETRVSSRRLPLPSAAVCFLLSGEMRETLTDAVEALNGARAAEAAEPPDAELARTVRVLDVHLSAFKWLDEQARAERGREGADRGRFKWLDEEARVGQS